MRGRLRKVPAACRGADVERGQSRLIDLAPYIADARALDLVLRGGKTGAEVEEHDWEFILPQLGWLHLDRTLGLAAYRAGLAVMFAALAWGAIHLVRHRDNPLLTFREEET